MEKMKNVIQSLKTWHKLVIGAALLAIVTGALLYFTLPDKYVVVYQNLNDADKQEITAELSKLGVDYQLAADGSIRVQKNDAPWVRKEMNGMGLPFNSKSGEEILLESSLGSSEQDKKMKQIVGTKKQLEQDIDATLMTMFKPNEYKVNTKVSVNYDEVTRQSEKYGDKGVLRSKQEQEESSTAQEGAETKQGVGITANGEVPNYGTNNNQNGKIVYDNKNGNKIENYEIDKTVETIKKHPELTKTNVVVWVDNDTLVKRKIDMTTFKEAIGTAAGLQADPNGNFTNGQVNVVTVQFDQPKEEKKKEPEESGINWWLFGGIPAGLLAIGGLVWFFLARRKRKKKRNMKNT